MVAISKISAKLIKQEVQKNKKTTLPIIKELKEKDNKLFENKVGKLKRSGDNIIDALSRVKDYVDVKDIKQKNKKTVNKLRQSEIKKVLEKIKNAEINSIIEIKVEGKDNIYYTLSNQKKRLLMESIKRGKIPEDEIILNGKSSDAEIIQNVYKGLTNVNSIEALGVKHLKYAFDIDYKDIIRKKKSGQFFKYYSKIDFNLKRYGILNSFDKEYYNNNCLYHALKEGGLSETKLETLKHYVKQSHVSLCKLSELCNKLEIKIILKQLRVDSRSNKREYGESDEVYKIGLYDEHYFIYDKSVGLTSYSLDYYDELKDKKNWFKYKGHKTTTNKSFLNSLDLFKKLLENKDKLLIKIDMNDDIMSTPYFNKIDREYNTLDYLEKDVRLYNYEDPISDNKKEIKNVFFDFETTTNGDIHQAYLVAYSIDCKIYVKYGYDKDNTISKTFLSHVCSVIPDKYQIVLRAHNLRYDLSFLSKYLSNISEIRAGGKIIGLSGTFGKRFIKFADTLALIASPLRDFPKMFGLKSQKEVIPYELYNDEIPNVYKNNNPYINIKYVLDKYFNSVFKSEDENNEDKKQFLKNIDEWNLRGGTTDKFNIMMYAKKYCEYDVEILMNGYNTFKNWINDLYQINIDYKISISGVSDSILKKKGCYDGCYQLGGKLRSYFSQFVVGGRTMIANNEKNIIGDFKKINFNKKNKNDEMNEIKKLTERISDFDGVSLYPSSMYRIPGFIKGIPKIISKIITYEQLKKYDYYFVDIKITKVGKKRAFSLMSEKNDDGVRIFHNNFVGKTIHTDKVGLEDLIKFHKIEFEIVRGYYFNEGFNNKINQVILDMFNERKLKKKKTKEHPNGNPIELVYKLIMNGAYGKSILKEQENEIRYFNSKKEGIEYMLRNYNNIVEGRDLINDNKFMVKSKKEIDDHYNFCHIGCSILSMSKRIMNEVICTAEDFGLDVYYQDTDSLHIKDEDIKKLAEQYKLEYNRDLIGKDLGQFHSDFKLEGSKKEDSIIALGSIFLGKKCYIDILQDEDGLIGSHCRLKGISEKSLLYTAKKLYGYETDEMNLIKLYYDLYEGKEINFDLTCDSNDIKFECFDLVVRTRLEFNRKIKFTEKK